MSAASTAKYRPSASVSSLSCLEQVAGRLGGHSKSGSSYPAGMSDPGPALKWIGFELIYHTCSTWTAMIEHKNIISFYEYIFFLSTEL